MDNIINLHMIGKRLKEAREKCNLTQAEVAEILGIHTNSYGNFERGTERPSLTKIIQCSIIFHIQMKATQQYSLSQNGLPDFRTLIFPMQDSALLLL